MRDYYEFLDTRDHKLTDEDIDNFVYGLGEDGPSAVRRLSEEQRVVIEATLLVNCVTIGQLDELKLADFSKASLDLVEETLAKPAANPADTDDKLQCLNTFQVWRRS